jgi:hypothetical protein
VSVEHQLTLAMPETLIAELAHAIASELRAVGANPSPSTPWVSGTAGLAEYLGWPTGRAEKYARRIPHHLVGARLMYHRDEVDEWVLAHPDASGWRRGRSSDVPRLTKRHGQ